jgi:hypothetical protein
MEQSDLLITLRIKGYAKPDALVSALGHAKQDVDLMLAHLTEEQLVELAKPGFRLTSEGQKAAHTAMAAEREQVTGAAVQHLYERFGAVNERFKALVGAWQMRPTDGKSVPNDHSDAGYDQALLAELGTIDHEIALIVGELAARITRLARYTTRFEEALRRLRSGEPRYMAAPLIDSYHTVWFELHEDLICLAGKTRAEEAAHGRAV